MRCRIKKGPTVYSPVEKIVHFVCHHKYVLSVGANFGAYLVIGQSFLEGVEGSDEYLFDDAAHIDLATVSVALLGGTQLDAVVEQSKDVVVYPVLIPKVEIEAVPAKTESVPGHN